MQNFRQKKTEEKCFKLMCAIAAVTGRDLEDIKNEACEKAGINPDYIKIIKLEV